MLNDCICMSAYKTLSGCFVEVDGKGVSLSTILRILSNLRLTSVLGDNSLLFQVTHPVDDVLHAKALTAVLAGADFCEEPTAVFFQLRCGCC